MPTGDVTSLFRAAARREWDVVEELLAELDRAGWPGGIQGITAVFGLAVERKFTAGQDVRDITRFVAEVREGLADDEDFSPLEGEAMIRAALGETGLADAVPLESAMYLQTMIAMHIIAELALTDDELDDMLSEADKLVQEWVRGTR